MEAVQELKSDRRRIWMLPALLIIVYAGIQAAAFAILPARDASGSIIRGGMVEVADLQIGDCFNWANKLGEGSIRQVDLQPCDDPHEAEAVGETLYPASTGSPWPGISPIDAYALSECSRKVDLGMMVVNIMPTEETWASGDRTISCIWVRAERVVG